MKPDDGKVRIGQSYAVLQACLVAGSDVPQVTVLGGNMTASQLEAITRFARVAKAKDLPDRPPGSERCIQFRVILKPKGP
jgi:hypothetical protein